MNGRIEKQSLTRLTRPSAHRIPQLNGSTGTEHSVEHFILHRGTAEFGESDSPWTLSTFESAPSVSLEGSLNPQQATRADVVSIDYKAIEAAYASQGKAKIQATTAKTQSQGIVLPTQTSTQDASPDPREGKVPLVTVNGVTTAHPECRGEVCECGTMIPAAKCFDQRNGVGMFGAQPSNPSVNGPSAGMLVPGH